MPVSINFYELTYNTDCVEGRGPDKVHARFVNKNDAVAVCNDQRYWGKYGVMGTRYDPEYQVREVCAPLFVSVADFWNYDENEVKKRALAKLTNAEKKALGLPL